jgi:hypothetical protein
MQRLGAVGAIEIAQRGVDQAHQHARGMREFGVEQFAGFL